jgi:hypothetical protein
MKKTEVCFPTVTNSHTDMSFRIFLSDFTLFFCCWDLQFVNILTLHFKNLSSLLHAIAAEFANVDRSTTLSPLCSNQFGFVRMVLTSSSVHLVLTFSSNVRFWHLIPTSRFRPFIHQRPSIHIRPHMSIHKCPSIVVHPRQRVVFFTSYVCIRYRILHIVCTYSSTSYIFLKKLIHTSTYFILICISTLFLY